MVRFLVLYDTPADPAGVRSVTFELAEV